MCVCGCTQLETRVAVVLPSIAHPARGLSMNSSHSCHTCAHMQESGMSERNDGGEERGRGVLLAQVLPHDKQSGGGKYRLFTYKSETID